MSVAEYLYRYEHHRWQQVAGNLFDLTSDGFAHRADEYRYDPIAFCTRNGRQGAPVTVAIFVDKKIAVAQAGLVKAHVRANIGAVEAKAGAKFLHAPVEISAELIAV